MLYKNKLIFFIIGIICIFVCVLLYQNILKKTSKNPFLERKFIEISDIAKKDKHFYDITIPNHASNTTMTKSVDKQEDEQSSKYLQKINKMIAMKHPDILILDKVMNDFLMNDDISRINKINGLWSLLNETGIESQIGEYLLDYLATLLPIELTDNLILTYKDIKNPNIKIKLINMLSENVNIANPEVQDEERLMFIGTQIEKIQHFLRDTVLSQQNHEIVSEGLRAYANVSEATDVQDLILSLKEDGNTMPISQAELTDILTETALGAQESQKEMLPDILEFMLSKKNMKSQEKEIFYQSMIESVKAGVISTENKKDIATYLERQEPQLTLDTSVSTEDISKYYNWVEASTKIQNGDINPETIALESDNALKVSSILLYTDPITIQKIRQSSDASVVSAKLEAALENDNISNESKIIIKDALDRLIHKPTKNINKKEQR